MYVFFVAFLQPVFQQTWNRTSAVVITAKRDDYYSKIIGGEGKQPIISLQHFCWIF